MVNNFINLTKSKFYFSLSAGGFGKGRVSDSHSKVARLLQAIPSDRILLETDAPDQLPWELKQPSATTSDPRLEGLAHNDPSVVKYICQEYAKAIGIDVNVLAQRTYENSIRALMLDDSMFDIKL